MYGTGTAGQVPKQAHTGMSVLYYDRRPLLLDAAWTAGTGSRTERQPGQDKGCVYYQQGARELQEGLVLRTEYTVTE